MLHINRVNLSVIEMPLKLPFFTHLGTVKKRQSIIIEVMDRDGVSGLGEAVAFSSPWYTEETTQTVLHMMKDFLIPKLFTEKINHPAGISSIFDSIRRNEMAKSGIETAIWDLYAKKQGIPLSILLGGSRSEIRTGAVVATQNEEEALKQIEYFQEQGYQRIKVKISPANDIDFLRAIRKEYPHIPLMADANSAYTLNDVGRLKVLDEFQLLMIEQPLSVTDMVDHATLQRQIATPICLDESITSYHDAYSAIQLESCKIINIKMGRVGGLENARRIHDLCVKHQIQIWCGGMIEFGVSRAHNIALATLEGFTIPGDIVSSNHYWEEDIIEPFVEVKNGVISVPAEVGIGFSINRKRLKEVTIYNEEFVKGKGV
ncbi:o-succinylbenzoate synthase [Lederbergia wuyishanensis]|uniref:o-succinylbenzoate synthase n=1 Tax=Lederbergia wuyishanensis TaxID=1347903 RepID=A0ABU0D4W2_9BACI|nr:o-succinylbenzoate synthase [Lederbergia wuyishanensis]MCJ8009503.1 o-succinylbenzoate synthase [Lederbergia wuyishanensis]MDQ0343408.1 O-succinylbenzoate synthase [Lederbergia wuyishanensis]